MALVVSKYLEIKTGILIRKFLDELKKSNRWENIKPHDWKICYYQGLTYRKNTTNYQQIIPAALKGTSQDTNLKNLFGITLISGLFVIPFL